MRTFQLLKDRNIGLRTLNLICDFLCLDRMQLNDKISQEKIQLITNTIGDETFRQWLKLRATVIRIQYENAKIFVQKLRNSASIDELTAERILNGIKFLVSQNLYNTGVNDELKGILESELPAQNKVALLQKTSPFVIRTNKKRVVEDNYVDLSYDNDSEEAIMWALDNGYGELYGFG